MFSQLRVSIDLTPHCTQHQDASPSYAYGTAALVSFQRYIRRHDSNELLELTNAKQQQNLIGHTLLGTMRRQMVPDTTLLHGAVQCPHIAERAHLGILIEVRRHMVDVSTEWTRLMAHQAFD